MENAATTFLLRALDRLRRASDEFRVARTLRALGACGDRVMLSPLCEIVSVQDLRLGDDVQINAFTHIFAGGGVTIGDGTLISAHCSISSVTHVKNSPHRFRAERSTDPNELLHRPVVLGKNVWLGMGAIILPGVTVGDHAIVGAGAVVTRDVSPRTVVVGNPARVLQTLAI